MMRELAAILNIFCTVSEFFWIYCIIDALFSRRFLNVNVIKNKWILIGVNVLFATIIILIMNQKVLTSPWTLTMWIFYGVLSACIFWKCDVLNAVAVVGTYCFCLLIFGNIQISILGLIGGNELIEAATMYQGIHRIILILIWEPIWITINYILYKWIKKKKGLQNNQKYYVLMTVIGMIGGIFIAVQMLKNFSFEINAIWYLFCVIVIIFVYAIVLWERSKIYRYQMGALEKHNELLEKSYEQINQTYIENAKLYHDMRHHFNELYRLAEQENSLKAKEYLEDIIKPLEAKSVVYRTGVELLDVIFSEMEHEAQRKEISINFDVQQLPQDMIISQKDLCALYVNLLENAVEAAKSSINICVKQIHNMMLITIINDYIEKPLMKEGRFITRKKDKEKHGWGTKIVEQIIQKYEGNIEYKINEDYVMIEAVLSDL